MRRSSSPFSAKAEYQCEGASKFTGNNGAENGNRRGDDSGDRRRRVFAGLQNGQGDFWSSWNFNERICPQNGHDSKSPSAKGGEACQAASLRLVISNSSLSKTEAGFPSVEDAEERSTQSATIKPLAGAIDLKLLVQPLKITNLLLPKCQKRNRKKSPKGVGLFLF